MFAHTCATGEHEETSVATGIRFRVRLGGGGADESEEVHCLRVTITAYLARERLGQQDTFGAALRRHGESDNPHLPYNLCLNQNYWPSAMAKWERSLNLIGLRYPSTQSV